jgi:hypothetical protein
MLILFIYLFQQKVREKEKPKPNLRTDYFLCIFENRKLYLIHKTKTQ